jgi:hypothetical protein
MQRDRIVWPAGENLAINRFRLGQSAGLMVLGRDLNLRVRGHGFNFHFALCPKNRQGLL